MPDEEEQARNALIGPYAQILAETCASFPVQSYKATVITAKGPQYVVEVTLKEEENG